MNKKKEFFSSEAVSAHQNALTRVNVDNFFFFVVCRFSY